MNSFGNLFTLRFLRLYTSVPSFSSDLIPYTKLVLYIFQKKNTYSMNPRIEFIQENEILNNVAPINFQETCTTIEDSDAIREPALENEKKYCPNAKKNWKIKF